MITMDLKIIFMLIACVVYASAQEPAATVTLKTYSSYWFRRCIRYEVYCQQDEDDHPYQEKASKFCRDRFIRRGYAGRLAILNNGYVDGEIRDLIKSNKLHKKKCIKNHGFFIGLSDSRSEGDFSWGNGEMVGYKDYENWARGQPDNTKIRDRMNGQNRKIDQDCVQLWYRDRNKGKWDDEYCDYRPKGFVCEVPDPYCTTFTRY
uniref:PfG3 protein n=1 Tax=Ptychodera flava TaxID=63121 RepID=Q9U8Q9_PTYFL|nr:PfG3 [Ptychodera flava]